MEILRWSCDMLSFIVNIKSTLNRQYGPFANQLEKQCLYSLLGAMYPHPRLSKRPYRALYKIACSWIHMWP